MFAEMPSLETKIGPELVERLDRSPRTRLVRAVLLLSEPTGSSGRSRRPSGSERQEILKRVRSQAERALPAIDAIVERQGGRRIGEINALGSITIETTIDGIRKLAEAPEVKAVLEDQPIFHVS
jgi:hypothetical protein